MNTFLQNSRSLSAPPVQSPTVDELSLSIKLSVKLTCYRGPHSGSQ